MLQLQVAFQALLSAASGNAATDGTGMFLVPGVGTGVYRVRPACQDDLLMIPNRFSFLAALPPQVSFLAD